MSNDVIQAKYDSLEALSQRFNQSANRTDTTLTQVLRGVEQLKQGGWSGQGAEAFWSEMDSNVVPAMKRLAEVLRGAETTTKQIASIMQAAEEEGARLFKVDNKEGEKEGAKFFKANNTGATEPGYERPENKNSTSDKRIEDFKTIMEKTKGGRDLLARFKDHKVSIKFGDAKGAIAYCTADGNSIVLGQDYAYLSDYELAAVLVHEGTHSKNTHPFDVPIIGSFLNAWYNVQEDYMYAMYPFPEEYRAYRAQAEFWREVKTNQPPSAILDDVEKLIFDSNGGYRDIDTVYRDLHNNYGYEGTFNP